VRQAALPWQKYAGEFLNLPLLDIHTWPRLDTNLFLRDELIAYIREQGGIPASHARRDGRVQFIWNISPPNGVKNHGNNP
jgi:hypothetical protein